MRIPSKIKKKTFLNAVFLLSSGTIIAQILTVLLTPILTRLFSPTDFGLYTIIITAETMFGGVICARYDISIVSEKCEENIKYLIKLSIIVSFIFSVILSITYGGYYFIYKNSFTDYWYFIILIFLGLQFNGIIRILESVNNRYKQYKLMSLSYVYRTIVQNVGATLIGFLYANAIILSSTHVLGLVFGMKTQSKSINFSNVIKASMKKVINIAKVHYRQPIYSAPAVLMNRVSFGGIVITIESLYGLKVLGIYAIANKLLGIPLSILSNNVSKVFLKEASDEYKKDKRFKNSFIKTSLIMLVISVPLFSIIYFLSPKMIVLLLGQEWIAAGRIIQILCPLFMIRLVVGSVANGLQILQKQNIELFIQIFFIISILVVFFVSLTYEFNYKVYFILVSTSFSLVYLVYYTYLFKIAVKKGV